MSEERLNEIKDSIEFQLRVCEINNYETDMIIEEKELYNEVLSNKMLIQELRDTIDNQKEEIDRLNNLNKQLVEECQKLDDEETRLNNIIEELEKYIKTEAKIELYKDKTSFRTFADSDDILDKLKALKENK